MNTELYFIERMVGSKVWIPDCVVYKWFTEMVELLWEFSEKPDDDLESLAWSVLFLIRDVFAPIFLINVETAFFNVFFFDFCGFWVETLLVLTSRLPDVIAEIN